MWRDCGKCEGGRTPDLGSHDVVGPRIERKEDGLNVLNELSAMSMPGW
jgi:hypothetical protein